MKLRFLTLMLLGLVAAFALVLHADEAAKDDVITGAVAKVDEMAPEFTLKDAAGKAVKLSDYRGKFVVLEWVNFGCPFVKKYYNSGQMQKLQDAYREKGVVWLTICSSAHGKQGYFSGTELTAAIKEHNVKANAYLIDADGHVGHSYQAKTTPNMYVINPDGKLIYAGAIDDQPTPKVESLEGAVNYVTMALEQAMAGKDVEVKSTQPYGCSVKYDKK